MLGAFVRAIAVASVAALLAAGVVFYASGLLPPTYTSTASISVQAPAVQLQSNGPTVSPIQPLSMEAYFTLLESEALAEAALRKLGGQSPGPGAVRGTVRHLKVLRTDATVTSGVVRLSYTASSPSKASSMLRAYLAALSTWEDHRVEQILDSNLASTRAQIDSANERLLELSRNPEVTRERLDSQLGLLVSKQDRLAELNSLRGNRVGVLQVLQPATTAQSPTTPAPTLYAVIAFIVVLLVVSAAVFARSLD